MSNILHNLIQHTLLSYLMVQLRSSKPEKAGQDWLEVAEQQAF